MEHTITLVSDEYTTPLCFKSVLVCIHRRASPKHKAWKMGFWDGRVWHVFDDCRRIICQSNEVTGWIELPKPLEADAGWVRWDAFCDKMRRDNDETLPLEQNKEV